ncbi:hypothetical protein [Enteractinococcus helveticum]|uniref:Uncharacterized protein n=1 Tax=Enteractinococcus helveticum TaxID=1837282 RepID=A0A1B7LWG3_9MICC|nr:hypothetical protein [Enteractinococcus helveticum]OAV59394.1 hypothetical protein A6F49_16210 [Enteractinococcus helveticum]
MRNPRFTWWIPKQHRASSPEKPLIGDINANVVINKAQLTTDTQGVNERTVEAASYRQEGDYFVFYADASRTKKVLTIKASIVITIDTALEGSSQ